MRTARRRHWLLYLATALALASFAALTPRRSAGAANETFFTGSASCPVAHCNQHLDGREGMANGTILHLPVSNTPAPYATVVPSPAVAFNSGLGCTVGQPAPTATPNAVVCDATQAINGPSAGPFVYI